ncbi:hypothetical protein HMI54_012878 [Coelomomyces lativittatus]|nr:hypothetical protein HMI54_012878 [Coelomomyces lativittatus]
MKQPSLEQRRISYSKNVSQAQITLIHHTASLSLHYLSNILKRTTGQLYVSAYKHCFSSNGWETIHSSCQILMDVMEKYENCLTEMTPTSI